MDPRFDEDSSSLIVEIEVLDGEDTQDIFCQLKELSTGETLGLVFWRGQEVRALWSESAEVIGVSVFLTRFPAGSTQSVTCVLGIPLKQKD